MCECRMCFNRALATVRWLTPKKFGNDTVISICLLSNTMLWRRSAAVLLLAPVLCLRVPGRASSPRAVLAAEPAATNFV